MAYWLVRSEPDVHAWDNHAAAGRAGEAWTGIRNHQAKLYLMAMKAGDRAFFYHSNKGKAVVGISEVVREAYPDPTADEGAPWVCVDLRAVKPLLLPVTLDQAKADPALSGMVLVNNTRLSVQPVTLAEWDHVCRLGGVDS